jgi:hypothetical protein
LANSEIQAKLRETVTYRGRKHYLQQYQVFIKFASNFCIKRHVIKHKLSTAANAWAKDITKGYIKIAGIWRTSCEIFRDNQSGILLRHLSEMEDPPTKNINRPDFHLTTLLQQTHVMSLQQ